MPPQKFDDGQGDTGNQPSVVAGYTNDELAAALAASHAANPNSAGLGPAPGVDYTAGTPTANSSELALDWRSWLTDWGFPSDVIAKLDAMARQYTPAQADLFTRDAILYLRGTDWHKTTFVGFAEGFKSGLFVDEKGYRMYVQGANDLYNRNHGRNITTEELLANFGAGFDLNRLGGELDSAAWVKANRGDLQYAQGAFGEGAQFDEKELDALGDQRVGINNALGADLMVKVEKAQQRLRKIFEGTLAQSPMVPTSSASSGKTLADVGR